MALSDQYVLWLEASPAKVSRIAFFPSCSLLVAPSAAALERLSTELRHQAGREVHRRLSQGLPAEQRKRLDGLTERRENTGQSWLTWLRQMPQATKPAAMLGLVARLQHVRALGIKPDCGHLVHQARLAQPPCVVSQSCRHSRVEITLPDGTCVRVGPDVGLVSLRRIMAAVRR